MLVSIVIPAYHAQSTLPGTVRSVLAQTYTDWECVIVSDDQVDYDGVLSESGLSDSRIRHVSTGDIGSGCHAARNRGLHECRGEIVCALDADDIWRPRRLEILVPQAERHGASVDGPRVVGASNGEVLYAAFDGQASPFMLDAPQLLRVTCPLFPLTRRDVTFPRMAGIEHLEDVVSNLLLIFFNGPVWATPEPLMDYTVLAGSMCHAEGSAQVFDGAYAEILRRIGSNSLAIPAALRPVVIDGLEQKRALNRQFETAQREAVTLNFQAFVTMRRRNIAAKKV